MGELFKFKELIKKNNGKATTAIVVTVVLLTLIAIGSSPKENNTNILENSEVINEENIQLNTESFNNDVINENNEKIESNIKEEADLIFGETEQTNVKDNNSNNESAESNLNNEDANVKKEELPKVKEENRIDLNKLKNEELAQIPMYLNSPYYIVNNNTPFFYDTDLITTSYEKYSIILPHLLFQKDWKRQCSVFHPDQSVRLK